ncbi:Peptidoglycan/LPS O-acetylase OafA/YrhL, contains acyltransferase and SGNH-hydrolase domains [Variovorax sp. HW608]|uniref:acyltransferase family protein n=1 Tax=Variovorax sp. HW608 TaxID=1034889 RepID=UPI00081FA5B8|nr:acyltransferase [Variovorax sp. HW608]SCK41755.1 Peptidoglycan/LPS O-acetylase OafA/YrhL, contains acyltransferase and SGNH-hydrolase domains [Variovorax sp. HW608]
MNANPPSEARLGYVPAFDGIRAIAIAMVLVFHGGFHPAGGGYLGVDVFFVLSGFLITKLLAGELEQQGRLDVASFYGRRALRLYPVFLVVLACVTLPGRILWPGIPIGQHALLAGLYLNDYAQALHYVPTPLTYTWSLAVEEHFYVLWPLALPFVLRSRDPVRLMLMLYLLVFMWRVFNMAMLGWEPTYFRFDTRASGIVLGCMLALMPTQAPPKYAGIVALILLLLAAAPGSWGLPYGLDLALPVAEVCAAILVLSAFHSSHEARLLAWAPLAYVGRISYGIYLWHAPLMFWLREAGYSRVTVLMAGTSMAVALAALCYHLIDRPVRTRGRAALARWAQSRGRLPRATAERDLDSPADAQGNSAAGMRATIDVVRPAR